MARRLYLGRLPADTNSDDVSKFFDGYGRITDCRVMTGFGFIEFESDKDAEDAVQNFNGKSFQGNNIIVEFAKESRPRREQYDDRDRGDRRRDGPRTRRPTGIRLTVDGISRETSWQDLKDFGRDAGSVSFADINRDVPGQGILEYLSRDDADRAVKDLDNKELRGKTVRVTIDESRSGPDNYRRDDRRDRDDRYSRDDRYRDDRYRRDRSRSPRRDFDDRRRSPPRREDDRERRRDDRRGGEDRRSGGEDRRSGGEDRRSVGEDRDRKDARSEGRGGDGGWTASSRS